VNDFHVVEQSHEVGNFTGQETFTFFANVQDLCICESVLSELAQEMLHFNRVTAEQVGEGAEDVHDFLVVNLVVQVEEVNDFLNLLFKLH